MAVIPESALQSRSTLEQWSRERAGVIERDGDWLLVRVCGGPVLWVQDEAEIGCWLIRDGFWESWITLLFLREVRPGDVVIDVGANYGYYAMLAAYQGASVVAVEPHPVLAEAITRSAWDGGLTEEVQVVQMAAGAAKRPAVLVAPCGHRGISRIVGQDVAPSDEEERFTVTQVPLDEIVEYADLVKVDVEGSEVAVWDGMVRLREHRGLRMLIEVAPDRGYSLTQWLDAVHAQGWQYYRVSEDGQPVPTSKAEIVRRKEWAMLWLTRSR